MSFRKSLDTARPLRLAVLHTVYGRESFAEDLLAEVVGAVKAQANQLEVANFDIPKLRLYPCSGCQKDGTAPPCRVNDLDSKHYKAEDQFLPIFDAVKQADMVVISATVRAAGANTFAQTIIERLSCAHTRQESAFAGKVVGVVVASDEGDVWSVASRLATLLNSYGFAIPAHGVLTLTTAGREDDDEHTHDDESTSDVTSEVVDDVINTRETQEKITRLATSLVQTAKSLSGR